VVQHYYKDTSIIQSERSDSNRMKNYVLGSIVCSVGVIWHAFATKEQCVVK